MKVWLVTADLYEMSYGAEIYVLGIFSTKEKAEGCVKNSFSFCKITEIEVDETYYEMKENKRGKMKIDCTKAEYLGGYVE